MNNLNQSSNDLYSKHSSKREKDLFYSLCEKNPNLIKTKNIMTKIINKKLKPIDKKVFDEYIKINYDKNGFIKNKK